MSGSQLRSATNQRFQLMLEKTKQNLKKQDKMRSYSAHDVISSLLDLYGGKSPQIGTKRVSVTSAKTFFFLKDWAKIKSESSIIYVTMEKKHSGQAPTLGL